ncbi:MULTISPECIES: NnrS family protein [unclassified Pseudomonas]|uniref:NnrS family protein n=1 Tax=unclassified Pseudomonas TaxID=196821 RepID=UPI000C884C5C|nr:MULTISPECIES: NnrS family protein [unclassified Pseudomonas]PMZ86563.1 short-chain dehydrogenase [Pseudomonas sp. FW215-T2]PNA09055.1 short-chain dehydrogenase [Pseudomonas sp. FW215-R3]PNB35331.1 short-chain dehydrogenase [Pseudomonas sp. FW305-131]
MRGIAAAPVFSLGFRPFFLAGAGFAAIAVAVWALWLYGRLPGAQPTGGMLAWHRHEMPFGFTAAIIAGFLLTAVPNWTGRPGLNGWPLIGLVLVWLIARLAWLMPMPAILLLALQVPFLPLLACVLGRDLIAAGKRENYPVLLMVTLLAGCQALTLLGIFNEDVNLQRHGVLAALWLVGALMSVIGGRVIPFFIQRGLNRPATPAAHPLPGKVLLISAMLAAVSFAAGLNDAPRVWLALLFALISGLHLLRLWRWHDRGLWRVPLLWSLYLAYTWLAVATLAMALWHLGWMPQQSLATHSLAVGGIGGLVLAMIARVSLGHTGRPLRPSKVIVVGFALVLVAGVSRVLLVPFSGWGLGLSALLWCMAFGLFLSRYIGILFKPRV